MLIDSLHETSKRWLSNTKIRNKVIQARNDRALPG